MDPIAATPALPSFTSNLDIVPFGTAEDAVNIAVDAPLRSQGFNGDPISQSETDS